MQCISSNVRFDHKYLNFFKHLFVGFFLTVHGHAVAIVLMLQQLSEPAVSIYAAHTDIYLRCCDCSVIYNAHIGNGTRARAMGGESSITSANRCSENCPNCIDYRPTVYVYVYNYICILQYCGVQYTVLCAMLRRKFKFINVKTKRTLKGQSHEIGQSWR